MIKEIAVARTADRVLSEKYTSQIAIASTLSSLYDFKSGAV
jgi:hypothetical protein